MRIETETGTGRERGAEIRIRSIREIEGNENEGTLRDDVMERGRLK